MPRHPAGARLQAGAHEQNGEAQAGRPCGHALQRAQDQGRRHRRVERDEEKGSAQMRVRHRRCVSA
eukprot:5995025-Prymnesium_polylepis.1